MVLLHTHSFSRGSSLHLDIARIVAGSGAIALNVVVLLLLLIPAGLPDLAPRPDRPTRVVPLDRVKPPTPPLPPEIVDVVPPQPPVARMPVTPEVVRPVVDQVVIDEGSLPAEIVDTPPTDTGPIDIAPTGPIEGVRLEYASASSPPYPRDQVRAGHEGTVLLRVLVDVDGRPLQVEVEQSSGHRRLDDAARRHVLKHWTFRPAMKDGRPVQAVGIVPIDFSLG